MTLSCRKLSSKIQIQITVHTLTDKILRQISYHTPCNPSKFLTRFYGKISASLTWVRRPSNYVHRRGISAPIAGRKKMSDYDSNSKRNSYQGDPNCRSCTDFRTWARRQKDAMQMSRSNSDSGTKKIEPETTENQNQYRDCPLDKNDLGRATWGLLHSISMTYPDKPTETQKKDIVSFMNSLANLYPCEYCARDLRNELIKDPVDASSQHAFAQWLCRLHNRVNIKIGKPVFDCSKIYERWRDGWKDGSCD